MRFSFYILTIVFVFSACNFEPDPINYGEDNCHFCQMTIVERAYSAQMVTDKGKQYKYDAIECLVNDMNQREYQTSLLLVSNYDKPGKMLPVSEAEFVQNDSLRSPMGANLAAVEKESRDSDELQDWEELKNNFK